MDASCHPYLEINENTIQYIIMQCNAIQYNNPMCLNRSWVDGNVRANADDNYVL